MQNIIIIIIIIIILLLLLLLLLYIKIKIKTLNLYKYDRNKNIKKTLPVEIRKRLGWGCNTRTSQGVTHPSTTLAQARLTAEFWWDPVH